MSILHIQSIYRHRNTLYQIFWRLPFLSLLLDLLFHLLVCLKQDKTLIDLDGTEQKKKLGANAILAASIASSKLAAIEKNISLYKNLGNSQN